MKIFWNGRRINGRFDSFKSWMKRVLHRLATISIVSVTGYAVFMAGAIFYSTSKTEAIVMEVFKETPVLNRIADCESGNGTPGSASHFDKNGQVLMVGNKNGTVDVGKWQINEYYWGDKATELGYDLTIEEENKKMAEWIYAHKGTSDWDLSKKCWYQYE